MTRDSFRTRAIDLLVQQRDVHHHLVDVVHDDGTTVQVHSVVLDQVERETMDAVAQHEGHVPRLA